jgi:hypothetical protein
MKEGEEEESLRLAKQSLRARYVLPSFGFFCFVF